MVKFKNVHVFLQQNKNRITLAVNKYEYMNDEEAEMASKKFNKSISKEFYDQMF